ncbi:MAG TPA: YifB family Mg chelatase-like AAA ATPase [Rhodocyclaceae bacterium]|nr:YifB family Mg chelatase-like AAA ATPase [Rhodocyclaceae bacterium]HNA04527.1 YifB family Mg chelatase-like AAA ATPase [Rhodocyclaceae bacterium]HNB80187.1 YifB family Mg chelatase-like AAA ATPase [Rhodocyclaceae bacterium]HNC62720.1 YifB family Mg chelatase-like AAA ATPase [Rhodocyclaceae bacterium]HNH14635.1 YifB family Mg chelatase-like AAA ATPase [Rhodocyclaceae bacterium]
MSLAVLRSRALAGMDAPEVTVEVHLANGLPNFTLVGLPDTEVKEARDRVRAAIQTSRFEFPARRITVNLAPADLPKESGRFDLPIALGLLIASGQLDAQHLDQYEFAGELSLTGALRPIRGALAMSWCGSRDGHALVLPAASADEAALVRDAHVIAAGSLLEVVAHLAGHTPIARHASPVPAALASYPDLGEVKGQQQAKRALEVAAAGGHSLLMVGPPGTGKSMLAQRFPGLLPPLTEDEAMQAAAVQSIAGSFRSERFLQRSYRAPHHTASSAALVGGGGDPRPGEISLAHHGVLFLDELPEFDRRVLEALREPLETGHVSIARAARRVDFPARFQLVAAMNPCPCGYLGSARCRCTPDQVARYRAKLSGPLLDRIDMTLEVPALSQQELQSAADGESSDAVRNRVIAARDRQLERQGKPNAALASGEIDALCAPDEAGAKLLSAALVRLKLSARAYHRVLKLARTVADLAGAARIASPHVAEAIHYRRNLGDN